MYTQLTLQEIRNEVRGNNYYATLEPNYDAIRQIHAQPEIDCHNTLQVPHPSLEMWQARLTEQAGVKHWLPALTILSLAIFLFRSPNALATASHVAILVSAWMLGGAIISIIAR